MSEHEYEIHGVEPEERDPKSGSTLIVGAVGVVLTVVIVLLLEVVFHHTVEREQFRKVISQPSVELEQLRTQQQQQLDTYRWVDRETGVVAIPIERAMQLLVEEGGAPR